MSTDAENCRIGDPSQSRINGPKLVSGVLSEVLRMCFKDGENLVQRIGEDNILKLDWEWKLVLNYCWRRPGGTIIVEYSTTQLFFLISHSVVVQVEHA